MILIGPPNNLVQVFLSMETFSDDQRNDTYRKAMVGLLDFVLPTELDSETWLADALERLVDRQGADTAFQVEGLEISMQAASSQSR